MPNQTSTLEQIGLELANALAHVPSSLRGTLLPETLAELGISFPGAIPAGVVSAANGAATAGEAIPTVVGALVAAVQAGDDVQILAKGVELLARVGQVIEGFASLGTGLSAAGVSVPGDFGQRLFDLFVVDHLDGTPAAGNALTLLGVIERIEHPAAGATPAFTERRMHWSRFLDIATDPAKHFQTLYDWGAPGFTGDKLLTALHDFIARQGLPTILHPAAGGQPMRLEAFAIDLTPAPSGLAIDVAFPVGGSLDVAIPLPHPAWSAHVKFDGKLLVGTKGTLSPPFSLDLKPPTGDLTGEVKLSLHGAPATPFILFGKAGKSRMEVGGVDAAIGADFAWSTATGKATFEPLVEGSIHAGKVIIDNSEADGFIGTLLAGLKAEAAFDLGFQWSPSKGVRFEGAGSLVILLPVHISLGPIELTGVYLGLGVQSTPKLTVPLEISTAMTAQLGPLAASVDRLGVLAKLTFPPSGGNVGPAQLDIAFKPPTGVGLSIDAGIVKGGGYLYFDPDAGEYAGVAELSIADLVTVKAIGLISTKMPDGSSGFSLLVIITAEFTPIQLGFGFTLNGVGGLLGLNRAVLLDVLRDGIKTGAVNSIMFPTNVVANAPRIISDLKRVFPVKEDTFLVGPMVKFGWGTPSLVTLSLGVIVEIPPGNIAILGILKVALPDEDTALIQIQVSFLGAIDWDEQLLSFDASLFDSRVLFMTLEGDMAVRFKWGDNAGFLLSVGGFHPSFTPPPGLHLPSSMKRLTISILDTSVARIKVDNYFAVTSNTVQFGAHAYLFFGFDAANINGEVGFDVLFQFSPFYFNAQISGSLSIDVFGLSLLSISLRFSLEGPTPWRAKGTGSISILFFSIDIDFDISWGDPANTSLPPVHVMPLFVAEVQKTQNWKALPPPQSSLFVSLRKLDDSLLVLHPFGALAISQRAIPLKLTLDKLGNQKPDDVSQVDITLATSNGASLPLTPVNEQFAIAQFQGMGDADKLSRPSYQEMKGGVVVGTSEAMQSSKVTRRTIAYDVIIEDKEPPKPRVISKLHRAGIGIFQTFLRGAAVARSPVSFAQKSLLQPFADKVKVASGDGYTVAGTEDNKPHDAGSSFASEAMARDYLRAKVAANPALDGALHVLPDHEVNAA
jgi:hypothetical protein